jgi:outer membrane lipoprotein SlyB
MSFKAFTQGDAVARSLKICLVLGSLSLLAACGGTEYSPNTYAGSTAQMASKVDAGIVIGFREVLISSNGTVGAVTGGAAGGVLGAQVGGGNVDQALGGVIGSAVGGIVGSTIEHVTGDTKGWEYIVKKYNGDMISVTQTEPKPLALGQKVLVISSAQQARIVPDYSVDIPIEKPKSAKDEKKADDKKDEKKAEAKTEDDKKADSDRTDSGKADSEKTDATAPLPDKPTESDLPPPDMRPQASLPTEMPTAGAWMGAPQ